MGVFLGDELLGAGVNVTELTLAAETVKSSWPTGVVYWNEEWGPVVTNSTWMPRSSALHSIPVSELRAVVWSLLCYMLPHKRN